MTAALPRIAWAALLLLAADIAQAGLVAARLPIVIYDGPSEDAAPRYLLGKGYPLVVISETSDWLTVCMHDGTSGHVHRRDTRPGDNVVALQPTAVREQPNPSGTVVIRAGRELLLSNTGDVISGWLPVRHASGTSGFVRAVDVWGHSGC